jgi:hypothetical protein
MEYIEMNTPGGKIASAPCILAGLTNVIILIFALSLIGCAVLQPPIKKIYAPYVNLERNPVIIIPGIKGSELKNIEKDKNVWGGWWQFSKGDFDDLELSIGRNGSSDSYAIFDVDSNVRATNIFSRWRLFGWFRGISEIDIYQNLIDTLVDYGGFISKNVGIKYDANGNLIELIEDNDTNPKGNLFIFYYDWRRDNVLNAVNLERFITKVVEKYYPHNDEVKFNIVAHSMGGLIARFYLGYHSFCKQASRGQANIYDRIDGMEPDKGLPENIGKVVLLGTPNGGSLEILRGFLSGEGVETLSKDDVKRIVITMPSAYQLLPPACIREYFIPLDDDTKKTLQKLDNDAACAPDLYKFSLLNPVTWEELQWSAFEPDGDYRDRAERQLFIKKSLQRAEEFSRLLHKTDSNTAISDILKLMGGDCAVTLRRGMIQGRKVLLDQKSMGAKVGAFKQPDGIQEKWVATYYVPVELENYFQPGDGKVTRMSMLAGFRKANTMFVCQEHGTLFKDVTLQDNMIYELLLKDNPYYQKLSKNWDLSYEPH